jgi:hypothetical protein
MTSFASALQQYREALAASAQELLRGNHRQLYQLHLDTLADIEQRFAETSDPNMCRLLVESARIIHPRESFAGASGERLRQAIERLVSEVTPK